MSAFCSIILLRLFEYEWPVNSNDSRWYMLQEQVAEFLDIRGMQRRYPGKYIDVKP